MRHRPGYPREILRVLADAAALPPAGTVVDLGSGTGLLARTFLEAGHAVIGVEPNGRMRAAGERELAGFPRFTSRAGTAERTGLPDGCADLVSAGQAFHWFDPERTRVEARRILRRGGSVALVWNDRDTASPFLAGYETLLRSLPTYGAVHHRIGEDDRIRRWFRAPRVAELPNRQTFTWEGMRGRFLSSSYAPKADDASFPAVEAELRALFDAHARDGSVEFRYVTRLFVGEP